MLIPVQRAVLMMHCNDHPVAVCPRCSEAVTFDRLGADLFLGKRDLCPVCRADLTPLILEHIATCTLLQVQRREARERASDDACDERETWRAESTP